MSKKIVVTGATGLIGESLCKALIDRGDDITVFTGSIHKAKLIIKGAKEYIYWDYNKPGEWANFLNSKDAVIHLAGASIAGKRWTDSYKETILESRKVSTQKLVQAFESIRQKPEVFISSSATGYYGNAGDEILTEDSKNGNDFLSLVCRIWEESAVKAKNFGIRSVSIRTGIALSSDGGALKQMLLPYKFFMGGHLGSGKQWFPWIHIADLIRIYLYALDNPSVNGAVNAVAPGQINAKEFAKCIGKTIHRPSFFPVPLIALKLAVGEAASSIVASQRVIPKKLLDAGFKFKFENVDEALKDLLII
ncbi:MAG: TIGR01777 family oxidoreductase [Ignavibacteriaceae bacterium]|nr:TIGR01777 family oxidoreductase [Ignavibacteriaceae bacterium]